jgi:transcriptional regulator with XRE-family HTH domain
MRLITRPLKRRNMAKVRLQELADQRGLTMSQVQRRTGLTMPSVRRYWYNTTNGTKGGPKLTLVSLEALDKFAALFDVEPGELIARDEKPAKK